MKLVIFVTHDITVNAALVNIASTSWQDPNTVSLIDQLYEDWHKAWHKLEWLGTKDVIKYDMNSGNFGSVEWKVDQKVACAFMYNCIKKNDDEYGDNPTGSRHSFGYFRFLYNDINYLILLKNIYY